MLLSLHAQCMHHTFFSLHVQYLHSACTLPASIRKGHRAMKANASRSGFVRQVAVAASTSCVASSASAKLVQAVKALWLSFRPRKRKPGELRMASSLFLGAWARSPFIRRAERITSARSKIRTLLQIMYRTGKDRRENAARTIRKCRICGQTKLQAPQNSAYRIESVKYGQKFPDSLPIRLIATFM